MSSTPDFSRRVFVQALGLGAAGLLVGGGAAWVKGRLDEEAAAQAAAQGLQSQLSQAQTARAALDGAVADLQGQVTTLNTQLGETQSQNAQLASALATTRQEADALKAQLGEAQARLAAAEERVGRYQGLAALYDQLEGVGLDTLARDGLQAAAAGLTGALGLVPLLRAGVQAARDLLAGFEKALPDFRDGLAWLGEQVIQLRLNLYALERTAQRLLVNAATGSVAVFGGFIRLVLDYLPFDIGEKVRGTLDAAQALVGQADTLARQAEAQMFEKMSRFVSGGPQSWQTQLLPPLRDGALAPAESLVSALESAQTTFAASLQAPVQTALEARTALREEIAAYRAVHQL